ncbi:MAG: prenyltransferase [Kiritimatiellae bacterium]|nr:prenyltransferase [Kiritimatiellia bacterium]
MFRAWFFLFRPWSYTATVVPFLVAAAIGSVWKDACWWHWAGGLAVGLMFQATVNLLNTWGDERSGVDDVPGAIRTTPQIHDGLVSMRALFAVAACCAVLAGTGGLMLCLYRVPGGDSLAFNWELLVAGFIGFLGSTNYSTGVKFKYRGLGVPFVSFLMGPLEIAVALMLLKPGVFMSLGSPDLCRGVLLSLACLLALSLPVASLVGVIMHGNDMRDIPTDRLAGIVTLASWLGPRGALAYYWIAHLLPYAACAAMSALFGLAVRWSSGAALLLPLLCLPLTARTLGASLRVYRADPSSPRWRGLERASGGIHFLFGLLYSAGLCLFILMAHAAVVE